MIEPFPTLTQPAGPAAGLTCGWDDTLPDLTVPCGEPAAWHIRWTPGTESGGITRFPASLACDPHMDQIAAHHVWHNRHPATPACAQHDSTWHHDHCTEEPAP
jgi:hypothetical protein